MPNLLIVALENAFVNLLTPAIAGLGANIYPGHSSAARVLPCVTAAADGSSLEEDHPHSGNFWADVQLIVQASANTQPGPVPDPNIADQLLTRIVFQTVQVDNLAELLNAQGQDLAVFPTGCFFMAPRAGRDEQGAWSDILPIKVYCCASVLAP